MDSSTLSSSFLGVNSPYRQQVYRLQRALRFKDSIVDAASVDRYQGHKRDLIVVDGASKCYGPSLDVAITRARFGTVEVG